jgi:hypothetical protein
MNNYTLMIHNRVFSIFFTESSAQMKLTYCNKSGKILLPCSMKLPFSRDIADVSLKNWELVTKIFWNCTSITFQAAYKSCISRGSRRISEQTKKFEILCLLLNYTHIL